MTVHLLGEGRGVCGAGVVSPNPCVINFPSNFVSIWSGRHPLRTGRRRHTCCASLGKGDELEEEKTIEKRKVGEQRMDGGSEKGVEAATAEYWRHVTWMGLKASL